MEAPMGGSRQAALERVKVPAILLIVIGVLTDLSGIYNIYSSTTGAEMPAGETVPAGMEGFIAFMQSFGLVIGVLQLITGVLILMGGLKLKKLQSPGLVKTAAILCMIPFLNCCCLIGLPIGIWVFILASKPEIKAELERPSM